MSKFRKIFIGPKWPYIAFKSLEHVYLVFMYLQNKFYRKRTWFTPEKKSEKLGFFLSKKVKFSYFSQVKFDVFWKLAKIKMQKFRGIGSTIKKWCDANYFTPVYTYDIGVSCPQMRKKYVHTSGTYGSFGQKKHFWKCPTTENKIPCVPDVCTY